MVRISAWAAVDQAIRADRIAVRIAKTESATHYLPGAGENLFERRLAGGLGYKA